ncbi:recombinase family protein [Nonomuraea sp. NPDC049637]|uniref:recombinase family protein n=1 Tax=Nonomuraea sp. NPDC049637 TaxID=3154356 RepID=UPI003418DDDD
MGHSSASCSDGHDEVHLPSASDALIGLVQVSSDRQNTIRQHEALDPVCRRIVEEPTSGKLAIDDRPELLAALSHLRDGDLLDAQEVDRLGRNLLEGLIVLSELFQRGVGVKVVEGVAAGEHTERSLLLDLALALAQDRRRNHARNTKDGLQAARRRGRVGGRRPVVDADKRAAILARRERGESIRSIAAGVKVSVGVVHKTLTEAKQAAVLETPNADAAPGSAGAARVMATPAALAEPDEEEGGVKTLSGLLADLADELDSELQGNPGVALAVPAAEFLTVWERQRGDGDLSDGDLMEASRAAWPVLEALANDRQTPPSAPALTAVADRLADRLPRVPEREGQSPAATAGTGQAADRGGPGEPLHALLAGSRPGAAVTLERLHHDTHLIIVDGQRAGWADHDGAAWRVHGDAGLPTWLMATWRRSLPTRCAQR